MPHLSLFHNLLQEEGIPSSLQRSNPQEPDNFDRLLIPLKNSSSDLVLQLFFLNGLSGAFFEKPQDSLQAIAFLIRFPFPAPEEKAAHFLPLLSYLNLLFPFGTLQYDPSLALLYYHYRLLCLDFFIEKDLLLSIVANLSTLMKEIPPSFQSILEGKQTTSEAIQALQNLIDIH